MKFKRVGSREALPELVRRSGWRGLAAELPQAEEASAEERALWREVAAEVDAPGRSPWLGELLARLKAWSWPGGSGAVRVASLATGAVAAGWVLLVLVPPGPLPAPSPLPVQRPVPTTGGPGRPAGSLAERPAPTPTTASTPQAPVGVSGKRAGRSDPKQAEGRGVLRSQQAEQSELRKGRGNGSLLGSGRLLRDGAVPPRSVPSPLEPETQVPPQPLADTFPDEERDPFSPRTMQLGAEGLCAALTTLAPVPPGLEGFALFEVALGTDGVFVEGDSSPRTLVSGGEQVDGFVLRSVRELAASGPVGSSGLYSVALEAERQRWSCKAAVGPGESAP